jgi:hypothetical protein
LNIHLVYLFEKRTKIGIGKGSLMKNNLIEQIRDDGPQNLPVVLVSYTLLIEKSRKQPNELLSHFVLALQARMEVRAIVNDSFVENLRLGSDPRSEFFHPGYKPVESSLGFGQRTIGPGCQYQAGILPLLDSSFE